MVRSHSKLRIPKSREQCTHFLRKDRCKTNDAKTALKSLQNAKPIDILSDKNVGGDVLVFVNRDIPDALQKATIGAILSALNITDVNASGKMYTSMDIGSAITGGDRYAEYYWKQLE